MHLADELGQRPEVDRCVECDRMLDPAEAFRWVPPLGGVVCQRCPGPPAERTALSLDALKLLKAYQRLDVEAIAALRLTVAAEREVETAMRDFMRVALERDARSLAFLDEVRAAPGATATATAGATGTAGPTTAPA
jgi:DNA repair protein RecO (recombination protein O)